MREEWHQVMANSTCKGINYLMEQCMQQVHKITIIIKKNQNLKPVPADKLCFRGLSSLAIQRNKHMSICPCTSFVPSVYLYYVNCQSNKWFKEGSFRVQWTCTVCYQWKKQCPNLHVVLCQILAQWLPHFLE